MPGKPNTAKARWWLLGLIFLFQAIVLIVSPEEATLGAGIKPVYLHVSLTWTGMLLLLVNTLLIVLVLATGKRAVATWQYKIFSVALLLYILGFLISMYASWVNWGGIPFQEPRIRNTINVAVAGIAAWVLYHLLRPVRLKGLGGVFPVLFMVFAAQSKRMVLHPSDPVNSSPLGIRATFYVMFALAVVLAAWAVIEYDRIVPQPALEE